MLARDHSDGVSPRLLVVLGLLSAAGPLAMDIYLASLPEVVVSLDTDATLVQLTITSLF